jgi:ubiquinone/menaquinone biosynthesis C-methylase UbiE
VQKYSGDVAQKYKQTEAKKGLLIPALERHLPPVQGNSSLLDVGCGDAFFSETAISKGFSYYGLDISQDMLDRARKEHPKGSFLLGSSLQMSNLYRTKFDAIVISMLFLIFSNVDDIFKTLIESKKLLKKDGVIIIGNPHPSFDSYMRSKLFNQHDVSEEFKGYFASGSQYFVNKKLNGNNLNFENYHWTLSDYLNSVEKSGLHLKHLDECRPTENQKFLNEEYNFRRDQYPTYLALVLTHRK